MTRSRSVLVVLVGCMASAALLLAIRTPRREPAPTLERTAEPTDPGLDVRLRGGEAAVEHPAPGGAIEGRTLVPLVEEERRGGDAAQPEVASSATPAERAGEPRAPRLPRDGALLRYRGVIYGAEEGFVALIARGGGSMDATAAGLLVRRDAPADAVVALAPIEPNGTYMLEFPDILGVPFDIVAVARPGVVRISGVHPDRVERQSLRYAVEVVVHVDESLRGAAVDVFSAPSMGSGARIGDAWHARDRSFETALRSTNRTLLDAAQAIVLRAAGERGTETLTLHVPESTPAFFSLRAGARVERVGDEFVVSAAAGPTQRAPTFVIAFPPGHDALCSESGSLRVRGESLVGGAWRQGGDDVSRPILAGIAHLPLRLDRGPASLRWAIRNSYSQMTTPTVDSGPGGWTVESGHTRSGWGHDAEVLWAALPFDTSQPPSWDPMPESFLRAPAHFRVIGRDGEPIDFGPLPYSCIVGGADGPAVPLWRLRLVSHMVDVRVDDSTTYPWRRWSLVAEGPVGDALHLDDTPPMVIEVLPDVRIDDDGSRHR